MNPILEELNVFVTDLQGENQELINKNLEFAAHVDQLSISLQNKIDKLPTNLLLTAINYMMQGIPYKFGGELDNGGFDCSSFMQQVFKDNGLTLPRTSVKQGNVGTTVDSSILGDLVLFDTNNDGVINHVGLAITDVLMIHTAKIGENINICNYRTRYAGKIVSIKRVL